MHQVILFFYSKKQMWKVKASATFQFIVLLECCCTCTFVAHVTTNSMSLQRGLTCLYLSKPGTDISCLDRLFIQQNKK